MKLVNQKPKSPEPPATIYTEADLPNLQREFTLVLVGALERMTPAAALAFARWLHLSARELDGYETPQPSDN